MDVLDTNKKDIELTSNEVIDVMENILRSSEDSTVANDKAELGNGCRYEHSFTPGIYIRKMFIPKNIIIVTMVHKTQHPYFIMQGSVSVYVDGEMVKLEAPYSGITDVGTRRALRTHEDTLWVTIHPTEKTNVESIVKDVVANTMKEFESWQRQLENKGE